MPSGSRPGHDPDVHFTARRDGVRTRKRDRYPTHRFLARVAHTCVALSVCCCGDATSWTRNPSGYGATAMEPRSPSSGRLPRLPAGKSSRNRRRPLCTDADGCNSAVHGLGIPSQASCGSSGLSQCPRQAAHGPSRSAALATIGGPLCINDAPHRLDAIECVIAKLLRLPPQTRVLTAHFDSPDNRR